MLAVFDAKHCSKKPDEDTRTQNECGTPSLFGMGPEAGINPEKFFQS
jgi:hypothetical protein